MNLNKAGTANSISPRYNEIFLYEAEIEFFDGNENKKG